MVESFISEHSCFEGFIGETAVIWGEQDPVLSWEQQRRILPANMSLKEANIHLLPTGHLVPEDQPAFIDSVITDFLFPK
jgi:pimeloyl-ACP methyl ester carboxylesterase